ncbi:MAG: hypothetical protein WDN06_03995 [Asticcacaulis sp.]
MNRRALLSALLALAASPALAQGHGDTTTYITPPKFNPADQARITKATAYLQALATGQGRFQQTDFRGRITTGNWYLARPGKIRFEYDRTLFLADRFRRQAGQDVGSAPAVVR